MNLSIYTSLGTNLAAIVAFAPSNAAFCHATIDGAIGDDENSEPGSKILRWSMERDDVGAFGDDRDGPVRATVETLGNRVIE